MYSEENLTYFDIYATCVLHMYVNISLLCICMDVMYLHMKCTQASPVIALTKEADQMCNR